MFDGFSSAGSELWTARRRTFCWEPRGDFKLVHSPVWFWIFCFCWSEQAHIDTHKAFLHRHFSKETTSRTLDKMKVLLLDWVAQQRLHVVSKRSPDNTSINEKLTQIPDKQGKGLSWVETDSLISWRLICSSLFAVCSCVALTVTLLWGCF